MEVRFLQAKPSAHLLCPLCSKVLVDPYISTNCGHTFCKECINSKTECSIDNKVFSKFSIVSNVAIKDQLAALNVYCQYHFTNGEVDEKGCQELIPFDQKLQHEELCEFGFVTCPYECTKDLQLRRHELNNHCLKCQSQLELSRRATSVYDFAAENQSKNGIINAPSPTVFSEDFVVQCSCNNEIQFLRKQNVDLMAKVTDLTDKVNNLMTAMEAGFNRIETSMKNSTTRVTRSASMAADVSANNSIHLRRNRQSSGSTASLSEAMYFNLENWAMPFAFKCIGIMKGHTKEIHCMAMQDNFIFTGGVECIIRVWDISLLVRGQIGTHDGKGCIAFLKGHTATITCVAVQGDSLFSTGSDLTLKKWNLQTRLLVKEKKDVHKEEYVSMVSMGLRVICGTCAEVHIFFTETLDCQQVISGLHHWVRALAFSRREDLVVGGAHGTIHLWDVNENQFVAKGIIKHEFGSVYSVAVTNKLIIAGTYNRNIQLFDVMSHTHLTSLRGHVGCVTALLTSPSGRWLFSASTDSTLQVWDLEQTLPVQSLSRHTGSVQALGLFGDLLFSVGDDTEIKVYKYFKLDTLR